MSVKISARFAALAAGALVLAGCEANFEHLGPGLKRPPQAQTTATRPPADANGVISYPSYQVVQARGGDTVADVANRVGMAPAELARHNGLPQDHELRAGELLALPRRVESVGGGVDIATIAGDAINRADARGAGASPTAAAAAGVDPIRHRVERGETAYSIARLYDVSVTSLASWNALPADLTLREGQVLLIPVVLDQGPGAAATTPGSGSTTPVPPSSTKPLPKPVETATLPASPNLKQFDEKDDAKFLFPVDGKIIKPFSGKGGNEGIDIGAPEGTAVKAAADGEVALVSRAIGQSTIVLVRHADSLFTVYSNLKDVKLEKGAKVRRGQPLGKISGGNPPFLHFEVRRGTDATDPMPFLE